MPKAARSSSMQPKKQLNAVQKNIIHAENIKNESRYSDRNKNLQFQLNPLNSFNDIFS